MLNIKSHDKDTDKFKFDNVKYSISILEKQFKNIISGVFASIWEISNVLPLLETSA